MPTEFEFAVEQICEEKGISKEAVIETIEAALAAAYRKDYGEKGQNVVAEFDPKTGRTKVFEIKEVVEEVEKPKREITLEEAKKVKKDAKVGDEIRTEVTPEEIKFGRIAAQTAKQVITQKIREAEKNAVYDTFKDKIGEAVNGIVQRIENGTIFVDLSQASGILPAQEQIPGESYRIGDRVRVLINKVDLTPKGPEILLSRAHPDMIRKLFEMEVPEIAAGTVKIKSIAREAGSRSKVAVYTTQEEVDPIGACVGQRGARIQTIISELNGEKIDIIEWDENIVKFVANSLSPAKVLSVKLDEKNKHAMVEVAEDQLSLAIGKGGQNVRLAVKLTGWKIDVIKEGMEEKVEIGGGARPETKDRSEAKVKGEKRKKEKKKEKKEREKKREKKKDEKEGEKEPKKKSKPKAEIKAGKKAATKKTKK
jgi:N utilization substance protein A